VCGHAFYNDTLIGAGGDITNPGAGLARYDRVVLRCNFSAADYVPGFASAALFTVPSYTARITIVHGADGGGVPALTQDQTLATYWDIPLYQYIITEGGGIGTITALTDQREWVDAETKRFLIPFTTGYNADDGTSLIGVDNATGLRMPDLKDCYASAYWAYPKDFISDLVLTPIATNPGLGPANFYMKFKVNWGICADTISNHSDDTGWVAVAEPVGSTFQWFCMTDILLSSVVPSPEDLLEMKLERQGNHGSDTSAHALAIIGVLVEYLGWH